MRAAATLALTIFFVRSQPLASDTAENLRLTQYRQQHRRTEDGRLCAAAFVQNKQRFTDCTTTLAPDKTTTGTEWCYVEAQYNKVNDTGSTEPSWGFCRPIIDYDYIRAAATQSLQTRIDEVSRLSAKLAADKAKIDDVIDRYERICNRELSETEKQVKEMEQLMQHGLHALSNAEEASDSIIALDAALEEMSASAEEEFTRALAQPENCRAVRGYEDDMEPDGMRGIYFPTATFTCSSGSKQVRIDPTINFAWTGRQPAPGIPNAAFSVRWDGYLQAPESAEYKLSLESDCGGRVYLNRKLIITDRMPDSAYELNSNGADREIPLLPPSGFSGVRKVTSRPLILTGGQKIQLRVEYVHSAHLLWKDEDTASVKLSWSSARIPEQPIPPDFFYSSNPSPVLKLSRLPAASTDIQYMSVGIEPFLGDPTSFVGDLSPELDNAKIVRMSKEYQHELATLGRNTNKTESTTDVSAFTSGFFEFSINVPAQMFVAYLHASPLEVCIGRNVVFKRYNRDAVVGIYVYKGGLPGGTTLTHPVRASYVDFYKVDVATLSSAGGYRFTVRDSPFIVFFKALPSSSNGCDGGEIICLSDPYDSKSAYESCSASSTSSNAYSCEAGLSRLNSDEQHSSWRTSTNRGVGEYVEITFRETIRPTSFSFKPLSDPLTWPSELTVYFEPGGGHSIEPQKFNLVYSSDTQLLKYTLIPESTKYLRFEITGMYASGQSSGGNVEVMGTICDSLESVASLSNADSIEVSAFAVDDCDTVVADLPDVPPLRANLLIDVDCPNSCNIDDSAQSIKVFGTGVYSTDSAICLAAIHSGVCTEALLNNVCKITLLLVTGAARYIGIDRNGILSGTHGPSDLSFVVQPRIASTSREAPSTPMAATSGQALIIVFSGETKTTNHEPNKAWDNGAPYGPHQDSNMPDFGWQRQAAPTFCDTPVSSGTESNQGNGVAFPPSSATSPLCDGTVDCSENYWSIKLNPNVNYDLTVEVGNPCAPEAEKKLRYDMTVNGVEILNNVQLKATEHYFGSVRKVKSSAEGLLRLKSACSGDCDNAQTNILQLKIIESTS